MIILGLDPGSRRIGYGLIKREGQRFSYLEAGLLPIASKNDIDALMEVRQEIKKIINSFQPNLCAIEKLYFVRNQTTGIAVGQTRGVLLVSLREENIPIKEFSPNEIKSRIAGYGLADKKAVEKMTALILGKKDLKLIDDAWDALAIALCGGFENNSTLSTP